MKSDSNSAVSRKAVAWAAVPRSRSAVVEAATSTLTIRENEGTNRFQTTAVFHGPIAKQSQLNYGAPGRLPDRWNAENERTLFSKPAWDEPDVQYKADRKQARTPAPSTQNPRQSLSTPG